MGPDLLMDGHRCVQMGKLLQGRSRRQGERMSVEIGEFTKKRFVRSPCDLWVQLSHDITRSQDSGVFCISCSDTDV